MGENRRRDRGKSMRKKTKYYLLAGVALAVVLAVVVYFLIMGRVHTETMASFDTDQMGQVLFLFAKDEGRLPESLGELFGKGYLEVRQDGCTYRGQRAIGRPVPFDSVIADRAFYSLTWVKVRYKGNGSEGQLVTGPAGGERMGQLWSDLIAELLEKKRAPTTTTSSAPQ